MASTSSSTSSSSAEASAALNISSALYRASLRRTYSATPGTSSASALIRSLSGQKPATSLISSCAPHTRCQASREGWRKKRQGARTEQGADAAGHAPRSESPSSPRPCPLRQPLSLRLTPRRSPNALAQRTLRRGQQTNTRERRNRSPPAHSRPQSSSRAHMPAASTRTGVVSSHHGECRAASHRSVERTQNNGEFVVSFFVKAPCTPLQTTSDWQWGP
jgi:hypothetical protein